MEQTPHDGDGQEAEKKRNKGKQPLTFEENHGTPSPQEVEVEVDNWRDGEVVGYPLLRLTGRIVNATGLCAHAEGIVRVGVSRSSSSPSSSVAAAHEGTRRSASDGASGASAAAQTTSVAQDEDGDVEDDVEWAVVAGHFKALVLLRRGDNRVRLHYVASSSSSSSSSSPSVAPPSSSSGRSSDSSDGHRDARAFLRFHYDPLLIDNRFTRPPGTLVPSPTTILPATTPPSSSAEEDGADGQAGREDWRRFVRLIYLIALDDLVAGEGDARAAYDEIRANAERMALGALMLQSFCADNMNEDGGVLFAHGALPFPPGRATFGLEFASDRPERNWPVVHVLRSRLTREQIYRLGNDWKDGGQGAWSHFASELRQLPHRANSIDCVIMGMTQYNPSTGKCAAHTALGGGQMALFGSGGMHTWARTLNEVHACWMNASQVDKTRHFDDSGGRGPMWANYATTLGATMHEIGHCFGLDHTEHGIMLRGFDNINRWAMIEEPGYKARPILKRHEGGAHWHAESISLLARSPYFRPASLLTVLVRLLNDHPSAVRPKRSSRFEPGVRLQVIPVYRPPQFIRTKHVRWEKAEGAQYFQKCDQAITQMWVEVHDSEVFGKFVEVMYSADDNQVILFDINRNLLVKIDSDQCYWASVDTSRPEPEWNALGGGQWKDDHFTGQH